VSVGSLAKRRPRYAALTEASRGRRSQPTPLAGGRPMVFGVRLLPNGATQQVKDSDRCVRTGYLWLSAEAVASRRSPRSVRLTLHYDASADTPTFDPRVCPDRAHPCRARADRGRPRDAWSSAITTVIAAASPSRRARDRRATATATSGVLGRRQLPATWRADRSQTRVGPARPPAEAPEHALRSAALALQTRRDATSHG
jgi:hypothetical protein